MIPGVSLEPVDVNDTPGVPEALARSFGMFALRVHGDSLIEEQICDGDTVLVQSVPAARDGDTVVAVVQGEATIKRWSREAGSVLLRSTTERSEPIVSEEDDVEIRGVVVAVVRKYQEPVGSIES